MLTSFQAIGTSIAAERENGQLERLQLLGTPPVAYFAGKAGQVLVTTAAQLALLLPVAHYAYDVPMPADLAHWLTFGWVAVLGAPGRHGAGHRGLGAAGERGVGRPPASPRSRSCCSSSPGSSSASSSCRGWMQQVAALFPLKWLTQGMRSAFLPDEAAAVRDRRQLGARQDRPGACRMGDHRCRGVRADVPLASGRRVSSGSLRPVAVDPSREEAGGGPPLSARGWRITVVGLHVVFVVLVGIAVVDDPARADRGVPAAAARGPRASWRVAYVFLGAPALTSRDQRRADAYLARPGARLRRAGLAGAGAAVPAVHRLHARVVPGRVAAARGRSGRWRSALASTVGPAIAWTQGERAAVRAGADPGRAGLQHRHGHLDQPGARAEPAAGRADPGAGARPAPSSPSCTTRRAWSAERERLAREVHDTLAQGYTSIVVLAQTAAAALPPGADGVGRAAGADRGGRAGEPRRGAGDGRRVLAGGAGLGRRWSRRCERLVERFGRETGLATRLDTAALGDGGAAS